MITTFDPRCNINIVHRKLRFAVVFTVIIISGSATKQWHRLWESASDSCDFHNFKFDPQIWAPKRSPTKKLKSWEVGISYLRHLDPPNPNSPSSNLLHWFLPTAKWRHQISQRQEFNTMPFWLSRGIHVKPPRKVVDEYLRILTLILKTGVNRVLCLHGQNDVTSPTPPSASPSVSYKIQRKYFARTWARSEGIPLRGVTGPTPPQIIVRCLIIVNIFCWPQCHRRMKLWS